ncbi:fibroblast growth factor receptor-like 1 [Leguminivora glycinivorella]|uniref:fibroblast growth factor receptor-like 1 n=1 Tax=Leguminivora glycinivorella TaxID=1035111 RepID=UPI0020104163|nr:fibroblast growth factor receptor-like 1 [Leguminivora glycinivorella]
MLRQFLVFLAICAFTTAFLQDKIAEDTAKRIAPKFKRKLTNVLMKPVGSSVRLKCAADGNPTPNITWSKNNGPIIRRYFQPRYGKWSVYFEELGKPDDGNYTCLVCNGLGCISNTFVLTVVE